MKPALGSRFFFLICVLTCSAHNGAEESLCPKGTICARGLILPIDEEPRPVAVWTEKGDGVRVDGPGIFKYVRQRSEAKWLNFTAVQRGSEFCVSSETFPGELCEKNRDRLDLWTGSETKWNVEPANITSGCNQYSLLYLALDLHDSPTKLLWRPGERAESLRLGLWRTGSRKNVFIVPRKTDSQLQYDMTFQRVSDDASCAVTSASINVSRICLKDQKEIIYISIASLDDNGSETPSYFSFNCEDGAGWQTGATASSPDDNSTEDSTSGTSWYSSVFVRFVFGIALVAMVAWVAKTYQGNLTRPPAPVLSSFTPQLLPQGNSFAHPDDQEKSQKRYENEKEHVCRNV